MTNNQYDTLKKISLVIAPLCVFVASLVSIWGIPYGDQIVATLAAIDTLLGTIVVIVNRNWEK